MSIYLVDLKNEFITLLGNDQGLDFFEHVVMPIILLKGEMQLMQYDLDHYSNMFINTIIPQTEKFNKQLLRQYNDRELFDSFTERAKNNEILSLAYMGLYHKIENYQHRIIQNYNSITGSSKKDLTSIEIDINNDIDFEQLDRLRLICNSIKHNNLYPKKGLKKYYQSIDLNTQLDLRNFDFSGDVLLMKEIVANINISVLATIIDNLASGILDIECAKLNEIKLAASTLKDLTLKK